MTEILRAVGYIRVSTPNQAEDDRISPEDQRTSITRYIEKQGWTLTKFYEDLGVSGSSMVGRVELQKLKDDAFENQFERVVCDKADRFGRNTEDSLRNIRELGESDVQLAVVKGGVSGRTFRDKYRLRDDINRGEYEKDLTVERLFGSRRKNFIMKNHGTVGQLPFGRFYQKIEVRGQLKRDYEAGIQLDEQKADLIRRAATEYLTGKSIRKIADEISVEMAEVLKSKGEEIDVIQNGTGKRKYRKHPMHHTRLLTILKNQCGAEWEITYRANENFNDMEEPVTLKLPMPAILDNLTITKIRKQMASNQKFACKQVS